jgi:hypothetical protein
MNVTIFYAVTIGLLTVLGAGLAGHLAAKESWHKWFFWGSGLLIVVLIYFQARSYKEPPSVDDIANAVKKKLSETRDTNTQALASVPPTAEEQQKSEPKKAPRKPVARDQNPTKQESSSMAHLSVTQSLKISTRADAPIETAVVVQTDRVFPSLKFVMQCDKPLMDAQPTIGGTNGMVQMVVSSGLAQNHPNVVVYSYGSSVPPFGPANPLIIDVWSKEPVMCNHVATF